MAGPEHVDTLRATAAHSVRWAMLQMVGATGGRLLFTMLFARLLGPGDFGIMAAATVYISLVMLLLDQGFGAALVQRQNLRDGDIRTVATLNVSMALVFMVATILLAPSLADFFRTPELVGVLRVLSVNLLVKGLTIVPLMTSRRAFEFRQLAVIQSSAVVVGGVAGLIAITAGAGYWTLVVQTIVTDVLVLMCLIGMRGWPRFGFERGQLGGLFRFSVGLLGAQLMMFASQNADNLVIGRVLGPTALAYYAVAYRLQRFPLQLIGSAVNDVALPVFSRLQDEPERIRNWFITATKFVVLLVWPMLVLMAVGADVGVPLIFGDEWHNAIVPVQLLALAALTMISRWLLSPLCTACGRTDLVFRWTAVNVTLYLTGYLVSVQWGINAVALSVGIVSLSVALPQTLYVARIIDLPWSRFLAAHVPTAVGSVVLAVTWLVVAWSVERLGGAPIVVLILATIPAMVAYAVVVRMLWPAVLSECRSIAGLSRRRQARPAAAGVGITGPDPALSVLRSD
ncbi:lipopolysaccharide biosynthesis protein [Desertimonas flava]|uniref:lipopolysaccharide biosynthesis protein n=1 Tax=Desertimonas flava TaxID=2064846 RepID=UPI0013C4D2C5|nr:lipopolysaccharide biosynthesis protein [Desertimonas flava]